MRHSHKTQVQCLQHADRSMQQGGPLLGPIILKLVDLVGFLQQDEVIAGGNAGLAALLACLPPPSANIADLEDLVF